MKAITIEYHALLREQRGTPQETLRTGAPTARALYEELRTQYGFSLPVERINVAVNEELSSPDHKLRDGDQVVFLPPVAGG